MRTTTRIRAATQAALVLGLTGLLLSGLPVGSALADESLEDSAIEQIIVDQLAERPGGTVVGNEIRYDDGVVFVAVPAETYSLSQCTSGRFCGWASPNYLGSFYSVTGSGAVSLTWTARSYSNNRSSIARLFNAGGTTSLCFNPGQDRATVATAYHNPSKVNLASGASC